MLWTVALCVLRRDGLYSNRLVYFDGEKESDYRWIPLFSSDIRSICSELHNTRTRRGATWCEITVVDRP